MFIPLFLCIYFFLSFLNMIHEACGESSKTEYLGLWWHRGAALHCLAHDFVLDKYTLTWSDKNRFSSCSAEYNSSSCSIYEGVPKVMFEGICGI